MASTEALLGRTARRSKKWQLWGAKTRAIAENAETHQDEGALVVPLLLLEFCASAQQKLGRARVVLLLVLLGFLGNSIDLFKRGDPFKHFLDSILV